MGLSTSLGQPVDLGLEFTDSEGQKVRLKELSLKQRPLIIVPVYYSCPRLCGLLMSGVRDLLNQIELKIGQDYSVIAVSFNSEDRPEQAARRKLQYTKDFKGHGDLAAGWHFLVGEQDQIDLLMNQIGFNYRPDGKEFAHTSAMILLTPNGEISQYFTGIDFSAWDTKLALIEASQGNIGSALDHALLFCFRFDPSKGKYTWAAVNVMRAGGVLTLVLLVALIVTLKWRERLKIERSDSNIKEK